MKTGKYPPLPKAVTQPTVFISEEKDFKYLRSGRLVIVEGEDRDTALVVEKERVTIGRSNVCDLTLRDGSVSGVHCEVVAGPDGFLLRDLGSTNGIFMLGHRIRELYLRPGSEFQIGNNLIRFEPLENMVKIPLSRQDHFGAVLGRSVPMREVFAVLERVSTSDLPVLLRGETGTGKELLASAIHAYSFRKNHPFIVLDCGAVPATTIESTLFGHEKGAFTGAVDSRRGVFEEASGGTLFIDEVGDLAVGLQPKLLRALEQQEIQRVGGVKPIKVDVRIVAATHRNLAARVDQGLFREDLYYRLSVVEVFVPPLRDRPEDVPLLVKQFLQEELPPGVEISEEARASLQSHTWPGNVRELRNVMERAARLAEGELIDVHDLHLGRSQGDRLPMAIGGNLPYKEAKARLLGQFERQYLVQLMKEYGGNLSAASREAGLARNHLRSLCRKYDIPCGADS
jgi:DNA-binding NtrC family response regulator